MANIKDVGPDKLSAVVRSAVENEIGKMVDAEIEACIQQATERLRSKLQEAAARVAVRMFGFVDFYANRDRLVIEIKAPDLVDK